MAILMITEVSPSSDGKELMWFAGHSGIQVRDL